MPDYVRRALSTSWLTPREYYSSNRRVHTDLLRRRHAIAIASTSVRADHCSSFGDTSALMTMSKSRSRQNPDDLSEEYLSTLHGLGFNRLSIGMQSANATILQMFHRQHDLAAVEAAIRDARRAKFDNINLDVIFGSPGETLG